MKKRLWIYLLLALAVMLSACAPVLVRKPVLPDKPVNPAQPNPGDTPVVKVVTLAAQADQTEPAQPALSPTSRAIDEKAIDTIIANWRALIGDPTLELAFKGFEPSPNASKFPAVWFVDPLGNSYYASQETLKPIEFTQERPLQAALGSAKTPEQLREIAEALAQKHSIRFAGLKDQLAYVEASKNGGNNFFRWELKGTDVGGMPAILQFGLRQDGSMFACLNSLDLLP